MPTKKSYAKHVQTKETPQSEKIPGSVQIQNSAGGFAFAIDDWSRLDRFLILGCEAGTYYASEKKLTVENAECVKRCLAVDPKRVVDRIVEISESGRAPKQNPAIFALAMAAADDGPKAQEARQAAYAAVSRVCRTGSTLFSFVSEVDQLRGWGRGLRNAVGRWYTEKEPGQLAYQLVKYQQREGWSHRDLLRLSHPKFEREEMQPLAYFTVKRQWPDNWKPANAAGAKENNRLGVALIAASEQMKKATDKKEAARLIGEFNLPRECVPTQFLTEPEVWEALLEKMPMTAMIRNLATMTRVGLLKPLSPSIKRVIDELGNEERIRKARVHPITVLAALKTYAQGRGERGSNTWTPVQRVVDALDGAFYSAFGNVESTGKRWMLACDVSGSMDGGYVSGVFGLTPRVATGALALVTARTEPNHYIVGFTAGASGYGGRWGGDSSGLTPIPISPKTRLDNACSKMKALPMGGTDCALPMLHAMKENLEVDVFVCLTDNETWANPRIHPCQALKQYRDKTGINAKLAVVGMTSTEISIADPSDPGSMDFVGMDSATPQALAEFAKL